MFVTQPEPLPAPKLTGFPICLLLGCLAFSLFAPGRGWHGSLGDDRSFRQTQTATATSYMIGHAPKLAHEMPVVGSPWAMPYQLPL